MLISRTTQSSQAPSGDSPQQMQLAKVRPRQAVCWPMVHCAACGRCLSGLFVSRDGLSRVIGVQVIDFKRKGEDALRNSGLSYTIIRAGELVEEPGGYKALLFDQSNRIQDSISCADLADICVKVCRPPERNQLHDTTA